MENVEDAKGLKPDEAGFDNMTAKFVDQLADGGRAGYIHGGVVHPDGRRGFFKGAEADASAGLGSMSPGTDTSGAFRGGGDGGNNNITTGDGGGITSVVTKAPELSIMEKFKGYLTGGPKEDEEEKMAKAANAVTNFKDYKKTIQAKNTAITEPSLMKDLGLAKGGRAGYAKGGLAKILEL